jgi:hypothetical protein
MDMSHQRGKKFQYTSRNIWQEISEALSRVFLRPRYASDATPAFCTY